jgi:cell division protein FtsI (penicillin-binding protein 3)
VLEDVGISKTINWAETNPEKTIWGRAVTTNRAVQLKADVMNPDLVPDMKGMGARDAVYLLEKMGLRVRMNGFGIVTQQSLPQGHHIVKGETMMLRLEMKGYDDENFEMSGAPDTLKAKSATSSVQTDTMLAKRKVESGKSGQEKKNSEKFVPEKKKPGDNKEKLTTKKEAVHQTDENKITTKAKTVTAKKKQSSDKESSVVEQKKAKSSSEKTTSNAEKGKKESTKDKTSKSKNN